MAVYNLDQTELKSLLSHHVSAGTENAIINALKSAGDYPTGKLLLPTYEDDTASGDKSITLPSGVGFFLEEGAAGNVTITSPGHVVIAAGDGNTIIKDDGPGGDTLIGGAHTLKLSVEQGSGGNNLLEAGSGHTTLYGGAGHDTLIGGGHSELVGGSGANLLRGGLSASAADTLVAGSGNQRLVVFSGDNLLIAGSGKDSLYGGSGHDTIRGGSGADSITAGSGTERIIAGTGNESIHGGAGTDTVFVKDVGNDTIFSGSGKTTVHIDQSSKNIAVDTKTSHGVTAIIFDNGQTIEAKGVKIDFSNGHSQNT